MAAGRSKASRRRGAGLPHEGRRRTLAGVAATAAGRVREALEGREAALAPAAARGAAPAGRERAQPPGPLRLACGALRGIASEIRDNTAADNEPPPPAGPPPR